MITERLSRMLPQRVLNQVEAYADAASTLFEVHDPRVLTAIGPSAVRGTILKRGKQGRRRLEILSSPIAHLRDWTYPHDHPKR